MQKNVWGGSQGEQRIELPSKKLPKVCLSKVQIQSVQKIAHVYTYYVSLSKEMQRLHFSLNAFSMGIPECSDTLLSWFWCQQFSAV